MYLGFSLEERLIKFQYREICQVLKIVTSYDDNVGQNLNELFSNYSYDSIYRKELEMQKAFWGNTCIDRF